MLGSSVMSSSKEIPVLAVVVELAGQVAAG
jgi:hypothetical protein